MPCSSSPPSFSLRPIVQAGYIATTTVAILYSHLDTFTLTVIGYLLRSLKATRVYNFLIPSCLLFMQRVLGSPACLALPTPLKGQSAILKT